MKGIVKYVNIKNGLCAIELQTNNFTIFEDLDENLSVGDIVTGNLESLGSETLYNETEETEVNGFIENIHCGENQLRNQLKF